MQVAEDRECPARRAVESAVRKMVMAGFRAFFTTAMPLAGSARQTRTKKTQQPLETLEPLVAEVSAALAETGKSREDPRDGAQTPRLAIDNRPPGTREKDFHR